MWFRKSTKEAADSRGLTGIVVNRDDGTVYLEAQGNVHAVADFLDWCSEGPELARVERLEIQDIEPTSHDGFLIIRK